MKKRNGKRVLSLFLAMTMMLSMAAPVVAVDLPESDGKTVEQVETTPNVAPDVGEDMGDSGSEDPPQQGEDPDPAESIDPEQSEAPAESEAPEESQEPEESQLPEETETPVETEVPVETEAPEESELPTESEIPVETEIPEESETPTPVETEVPVESVEPTNPAETMGPIEDGMTLVADKILGAEALFNDVPFEGDGTESNPYIIDSFEDMNALHTYGTADSVVYYSLEADIVMPENTNWVPIGTEDAPFIGSFEGNGCFIENLNVDTEDNYAGLFGVNAGYIGNVCVSASTVNGGSYTGGIAGMNKGYIINALFEGDVTGKDYVGGIIGHMDWTYVEDAPDTFWWNGYGTGFEYCVSIGSVTGENHVGGLAGYMANDAWLSGSYNEAKVSGKENVGGVAGSMVLTNEERNSGNGGAFSIGEVTGESNVGLLIGQNEFQDNSMIFTHNLMTGVLVGSGNEGGTHLVAPYYLSDENEMMDYGLDISSGYFYCDDAVGHPVSAWYGLYGDVVVEPVLTISTADELKDFRDKVNKNQLPTNVIGRLTADIDLGDEVWTPIGSSSYHFRGIFDGQGHAIGGLNVTNQNYAGLFGCVDGTVKDMTVAGKIKNNGHDYTGGIAGWLGNKGVIEGCVSEVEITSYNNYVGGIVGQINGTATVKDCINNAVVTGGSYVGGVVGQMGGDTATVKDCANNAAVTGSGYVGGIVGQNNGSTTVIEGCANNGLVTSISGQGVGGILGCDNNSSQNRVADCINNGVVVSDYTSSNSQYALGGIVGYGNNIVIENCVNTADIDTKTSYVGGIIGYADSYDSSVINCSNESNITSTNSFVGGIAGCFYGNIDDCHNTGRITGNQYTGGIVGYWCPNITVKKLISNSTNSGLITGISSYTGGIVGWVNGNGRDYSFVSDCSNVGDVEGHQYTGGIAGYIYAVVIEDCLNDSNINSDSSFVGGITGGINSGNNDTVKRCYNKGHISASDYVGGIVGGRPGSNSGWYYIYDCYNTGSVSGNSGVGGILGHNYTAGWAHEIKNCYNFGPIKANNNYCGSISGYGDNGTYSHNYFLIGTASGGRGQYNGTDGTMQGGQYEMLDEKRFTSKDSFEDWDFDSTWIISESLGRPVLKNFPELNVNEATYQVEYYQQSVDGTHYSVIRTTKGVGAVGTVVTANVEQFQGFKFNKSHEDNILKGEVTEDGALTLKVYYDRERLLEGSGKDASDPYQIKTREDLELFASYVNDGWKTKDTFWAVMNNIDLESDKWTPIGTTNYKFAGTFNGGYNTISGLYINDKSKSYNGLFAYNEGTIKNLTVEGSVTGNSYTGGIVSDNTGTIENCHNKVSVTGHNSYVGGVAGYNNNGTVKNSSNSGAIISYSSFAGGIVGSYGTVENCVNNGVISNFGNDGTGGIAGGHSTIRNCRNNAAVVSASIYVGGISGNSSNICDSQNYGPVASTYADVNNNNAYVGGLVGYVNSQVWRSANYGDVTASGNYVGGIGGGGNDSIYESFNTGTVTGRGNSMYVGGILGGLTSNNGYVLQDCYNLGAVEGGVYVGGIVGKQQVNHNVQASYNFGPVTSRAYCGAVAGEGNSYNLDNCFYLDGTSETAFGNLSGEAVRAYSLTKEGFAQKERFSGFNFNEKWAMSKTLNRPILKTNPEQGYVTLTISNGETIEVKAPKGIRLADAYNLDFSKVWQVDGNAVDFNMTLTSSFTLTAVEITEGMEVNYQVKHRRQNTSGYYDNDYDLEMKTAHIGDTVTITPKNYYGFHLKDAVTPVEITSNMQIITVDYERDEVTVTFEMGESGLENIEQTIRYGATVSYPNTPDWEKYVFVGWFVTDIGPINFNFNSAIFEDTMVYARWNNRYRVSFITGETATQIPDQYIIPDNRAVNPGIPVNPDHGFEGWYTDFECAEKDKFDINNTNITKDTVLYAKWSAGVPVHFVTPDGESIYDIWVTKDKALTTSDIPSSSFSYLFEDKECTKAWDANKKVSRETTIYVTMIDALVGTGSETDPYRIYSAEAYVKFKHAVNNSSEETFAILCVDLDFGTSPRNYQIGNFYGILDGKGHAININNRGNDTGSTYLFASNYGTIKNLVLTGQTDGADNIGILTRYNHGTIERCINRCTTTRENYYISVFAHDNWGLISQCGNEADMPHCNFGGIARSNQSSGVIRDCYNIGNFRYDGSGIGGIVDQNNGLIETCYNSGTITSASGGAIACSNYGTINNCYYLTDSAHWGVRNYDDEAGHWEKLAADEFKTQSRFINWDFESVWRMSETRPVLRTSNDEPQKPEVGEVWGSAAEPYPIDTADELASLAAGFASGAISEAYIQLGADLSYTGSSIGTQEHPFNGMFDGDGHTIAVHGAESLFGTNNGTVKALAVSVNTNNGSGYIGGIANSNTGVIEQCYTNGNINGAGAVIGGIAGQNFGVIKDCYSMVNSTETNSFGISGGGNGKITNCYSGGSTAKSGISTGEAITTGVYTLSEANTDSNATALSASQAARPDLYEGWDFGDVWAMHIVLGRPVLQVAQEHGSSDNVSAESVVIATPGTYTVVGESDIPVANNITVTQPGEYDLAIKDVSINMSLKMENSAIGLCDGAKVQLNATGKNTLIAGAPNAGIRVPETARLVLTGSGSLTATGGTTKDIVGLPPEASSKYNGGGAGIGGSLLETAGYIEIDFDGYVYANGSPAMYYGAAGIGGGSGAASSKANDGQCDTTEIVIKNGIVHAKASINAYFGAAGIGGGSFGNGKNITISGGRVLAEASPNAFYGAAGIGGGAIDSSRNDTNGHQELDPGADGYNITITGGDVTAARSSGAKSNGAGIGGGNYGDGYNIVIDTTGIVTTSVENSIVLDETGAGIGGGGRGDGYNIEIKNGTVNAYTAVRGAGIGGGTGGNGYDITITGGNVKAVAQDNEGTAGGAGIGGGFEGYGKNITITSKDELTKTTVYASGSYHAAGIGGGGSTQQYTLTDENNNEVAYGSVLGSKTYGENINIDGYVDVTALGKYYGAGIGGGGYGYAHNIYIGNDGVKKADVKVAVRYGDNSGSKTYGAGIGSGYCGAAIGIEITGNVHVRTAPGTPFYLYSTAFVGSGNGGPYAANIHIHGKDTTMSTTSSTNNYDSGLAVGAPSGPAVNIRLEDLTSVTNPDKAGYALHLYGSSMLIGGRGNFDINTMNPFGDIILSDDVKDYDYVVSNIKISNSNVFGTCGGDSSGSPAIGGTGGEEGKTAIANIDVTESKLNVNHTSYYYGSNPVIGLSSSEFVDLNVNIKSCKQIHLKDTGNYSSAWYYSSMLIGTASGYNGGNNDRCHNINEKIVIDNVDDLYFYSIYIAGFVGLGSYNYDCQSDVSITNCKAITSYGSYNDAAGNSSNANTGIGMGHCAHDNAMTVTINNCETLGIKNGIGLSGSCYNNEFTADVTNCGDMEAGYIGTQYGCYDNELTINISSPMTDRPHKLSAYGIGLGMSNYRTAEDFKCEINVDGYTGGIRIAPYQNSTNPYARIGIGGNSYSTNKDFPLETDININNCGILDTTLCTEDTGIGVGANSYGNVKGNIDITNCENINFYRYSNEVHSVTAIGVGSGSSANQEGCSLSPTINIDGCGIINVSLGDASTGVGVGGRSYTGATTSTLEPHINITNCKGIMMDMGAYSTGIGMGAGSYNKYPDMTKLTADINITNCGNFDIATGDSGVGIGVGGFLWAAGYNNNQAENIALDLDIAGCGKMKIITEDGKGYNKTTNRSGVGIGVGYRYHDTNETGNDNSLIDITITGSENKAGKVMTVVGSENGTAIGTGKDVFDGVKMNINLSGGIINASAGDNTAAIGVGTSNLGAFDKGAINISNCEVTATGGSGIGAGRAFTDGSFTVNLTDCNVESNAAHGAGLGFAADAIRSTFISTLTNCTGSFVGGGYAAGMGMGRNSAGATAKITILGGRINAQGSNGGAGIGCGPFGSNCVPIITIDDNATVTANGSVSSMVYSDIPGVGEVLDELQANRIAGAGAGIGGAENQSAGQITINSGTVIANGGGLTDFSAAGIGGGKGGDGGLIRITGGNVTATGGHTDVGGAAGIGGGNGGNGGNITITGGNVVAVGKGGKTSGGAGIGGGPFGNGGDVAIYGNANVTAIGSERASGIGGGFRANGHDVKIYGGMGKDGEPDATMVPVVVAKSGLYDSAAIGGGAGGGDGGDVLISAVGGVAPIIKAYRYAQSIAIPGVITCEGVRLLQATMKDVYDHDLNLRVQNKVAEGETPTDRIDLVLPEEYSAFTVTTMGTSEGTKTYNVFNTEVVDGYENMYLLSTSADDVSDFDCELGTDKTALQLTIIKYHTITFDTGEGGPEVPPQSVRTEFTASVPEEPVWEGHVFSGWYADPEFTTLYDFSTPITDNVTVYAKWLIPDPTEVIYKVEHYKQDTDGTGYYLFLTEYEKGIYGNEVSTEYMAIEGFHKNRDHEDTLLEGTLNDDPLTLKLFYDRDIIKVLLLNIDLTDGQLGYIEAPYGTSVMLPMPVKNGYEFDKWTKEGPEGDEVPFMTLFKIETLGPAVYANWTLKDGCAYQVRHFLRGLDGVYIMDMQEDFAATAGDKIIAEPYSYVGFHMNESISEEARKGIAQQDGSTVLRIYYDRDIITVNLLESYNDELTQISKQYGDVASIPTPHRDGFIFRGWYTDDGDPIADDALINEIGENATARWEPIVVEEVANYSTRYHIQLPDGTYVIKEIVDQIGLVGELVKATVKTFTGYTYNKDKSTYGGVVNDRGTLVLNMYYDLNEYEVQFDTDGGSEVASITGIKHGTSIYEPRIPTKQGYTFLGWYDEGLTVKWNFREPVLGDMTLYAKWDAGTSDYTVEYYTEKVTGDGYDLYGSNDLSGKTGSTVSADVINIKGFALNNKHPLAKPTGEIKADGSLVLKVYYDRVELLVKYESNGGTDYEDATVKYGGKAENLAPEKAGYDFAYWCVDHSLQKKFDFDTPITQNMTLYAKWTPRNDTPFTTLYYLESVTEPGTYELHEDMTKEAYGTTEKIVHARYPDVDGYRVNEDHPDSNVIDVIRGDGSTVLIVYYSCTERTVTFITNGGTEVETQTVAFGGQATAAETTKQGYTFAGWYTDAALTTEYNFETPVLDHTTLYAGWLEAETEYKVEHYLQRVAQDGYDLEATEWFEAITGSTVVAKALVFDGFYENKEYTFRVAEAVVAADGSTVLKLFYDRETVTLSFDSQGGSEVDSISTVYGGVVSAPGNPTKAGYRFHYWYEYAAGTKLDELLNMMEPYVNGEISKAEYLAQFPSTGEDGTLYTWGEALGVTATAKVTSGTTVTNSVFRADTEKTVILIKEDLNAYIDGHINLTWYQLQYYIWAVTTEFKKPLVSPKEAYDYWMANASIDLRPQWVKNLGTTGPGVDEYAVRVLSDGTVCPTWGTMGEGLRHDFSAPLYRDMTVYAKWAPADGTPYKENYYCQNILDDGYTLMGTASMAGKTGETATADTTAPNGFHLNENAVGSKLTGEITADGKLVLDVYFDRNIVTVTYEVDGGTEVEDTNVRYGTAISPTETTKAGYIFLGWYDGNVKFNFANPITEDIILTAKWELRTDMTYTTEYYTQKLDKSGYELTNTTNGTGSVNAEVEADTTAPNGFVFNPDTEGSVLKGTIQADGSLVLKVFFDRKSYTVTFDVAGGSEVEAITAVYGEIIDSPETTKTGHAFAGWYTEADEKFNFSSPVVGDMTLTAKWNVLTGLPFRIEYYYMDINTGEEKLVETVRGTGSYGQVITADDTPLDGYEFGRGNKTGVLGLDELVLKLFFQPMSYSIIFETNGGSEVAEYGALHGEIITAPVTTRPGYDFDGWWVGESLDYRYDFTKPITGDMTLYAKWVESKTVPYGIEYYYQNVNDNDYKLVSSKEELGFLSDYIELDVTTVPTGFILNETLTVSEGQVSLENKLVLKVYYDRLDYTLTFEPNGGSEVDDITARYGKKITAPVTTKAGYVLVGWFADKALTNEYDFFSGVTGNATLYAKWAVGQGIEYTVKYYKQNLNDNKYTLADTEVKTAIIGSTVTASTVAPTGFVWNEELSTVAGTISADGELVLEVYFDREVYTVSFEENGGSEVNDITAKYGYVMTKPVTTKKNHIFAGWFTDEALTTQYDFTIGVTGDVTLYAKWTKVEQNAEYVINYYKQNLNDNKYTLAETVTKVGIVGSTATADTTAPVGFELNETLTVATGEISETQKLVLDVYFDREVYTISFESNGGSKVNDVTAKYGYIMTPPVTTKVANTFLGWYADEGLTTEYDFTVGVTSGVTLYAKWAANQDIGYIIRYYKQNLNNDEYALVNTVAKVGVAGETVNADTTAPTGFEFNEELSTVTGQISADEVLALEVYFDRKAYTLAFESNGGSEVEPMTVRYGHVVDAPATTKQGYNFVGWYINEALTTKYDFSAGVDGNQTLYAKWEAAGSVAYKVSYFHQNINDDLYTLANTVTGSGMVGEEVTADVTAPDGFILNEDVTGSKLTGVIAADGSLELKVYFDRQIHTIHFETNGGTDVTDRTVRHGKVITAPTTSYVGHDFGGWFVDEAFTNEYDFKAPVTSDVTLYAKWVSWGNMEFNINYFEQTLDGKDYTLLETVTGYGSVGQVITAEKQAQTGFHINAEDSKATGIIEAGKLLVLNVYFDRDAYTLTFETNGGSEVAETSVLHGNTIEAPASTKPGFKLDGWYEDTELTIKHEFDTPVTAGMTLYAKWSEAPVEPTPTPTPTPTPPPSSGGGSGGGGGGGAVTQYTVTFETNGGSKVEAQKTSGKVTEPKSPEKLFYRFEGWFSDKELTKQFDFAKTRIKADTTLFAKWSYMGPSTYLIMDHIAYIEGMDDGLVHPEKDITRAEVAMIFYRLLNEDTRREFENDRSAFKDVKDGWYLTAVSTLARMGILKGRGNGYFDPNAPITRAEFAVICSRFDTLDEIDGVKFADVPKTYWAYKEIGSAAAKGWVEGIGGEKFAPNALISRAEAVTLINRVLGRATTEFKVDKGAGTQRTWPDNKKSDWYYWAMQEATNGHDYKLKDKMENWNKIITK